MTHHLDTHRDSHSELVELIKKLYQARDFVSGLIQLNGMSVPRCYFTSTSTPIDIEIHAFSDASKKAYATAVYLHSEYEDGRVEVILLSSKTRGAPIKQQTMPRLKLLGALISARH